MAMDNKTRELIAASVFEREALQEEDGRLRGMIRIRIDADEGVRAIAHSGGHDLIIDEPRERGGTDRGASPLAHFLSGIGT